MRLAVLIAMIGLMTFGLLASIVNVGKPRGPLTGGIAAASTLISAAFIVGAIYLYMGAS